MSRLTNLFRVGHIYYIPLGQGSLEGTVRQCTQCGAAENCDVNFYVRMLTDQEAYGRNVEMIMRETNPRLDERLRKQQEFQQEMIHRAPALPQFDIGQQTTFGAVQRGGVDPRLLVALQELNRFDIRDADVSQYMNQLRAWDRLTDSEREVLLNEVDRYIKNENATQAVVRFIGTLPTPTPSWVTWLCMLVLVFILLIGFVGVPFLQSWLWGSIFAVTSIVGMLVFVSKANHMSVLRWVNNTLIPRAASERIDLRVFMELLFSIDRRVTGLQERIYEMSQNARAISAELTLKGMIGQDHEKPVGPLGERRGIS